ncbi:YdcH family protein [Sessilibacter sp. MAH2]
MSVEHHDLVHELPEYKDQIHQLKMHDNHFKRLFDEYHDLTKTIENIENEVEPSTTAHEESLKVKRLALKDELVAIINTSK